VLGWIERYHGSKTHDIPEVDALSGWIQQHIPQSTGATLIHNDYKYDNVVLDPGDLTRVIGVLDWEMCTIGDPLTDLGSALAYWVDANDLPELLATRWGPTTYPGSLTRAQLVERYAQRTGREVSNMDFYLTFARFKIAVIVQQIYFRYSQGLTHDERFASMPLLIKILLRAALRTAETGDI
jgi:aminoglycoside phosphotransferase (APT) family kinase protein